jgi:SAM-dependent methyltransferase
MNFHAAPLIQRSCPACGAEAKGAAHIAARQPAEDLAMPALSDAWRGFFKEPVFFSFHRCKSCTQLFAPRYLSTAASSALYGQMGDNIHSGDETLSALTQAHYADLLKPYLPAVHNYAEIGPDIGLFLTALGKTRKPEHIYLAEANHAVWDRLRAAASVPCIIAPTFEELAEQIPDNSLDLAVAVHVLDHLLEPAAILSLLHRKLKKGGHAAFVVHNETSMLARILKQRWPAYCLQHPQLYNPETLAGTLEKAGLQVRAVLPTANYFPLNYLAQHGLFALTRIKADLPLPHWPLKLYLGNIMAVAVKP